MMRRVPTHTHPDRFAAALVVGTLVAAFAAAFTGIVAVAPPSVAQAAKPPARLVVVLLSPYLTWSDVSARATPALWALAERGAVGNLNARTAEPEPTAAGGALTISASRWALAPAIGPLDAGNLDAARATNEGSLAPPALGSLGDSIRAAGGLTAAVGCGDRGAPSSGDARTSAETINRPAELLACDASGALALRDTSLALTTRDASAPFGVRSNQVRLRAALVSALATLGSASAPALLVVDTGDLARSHDDTALALGASSSAHRDAVTGLDAVAAELRRTLPDDAVLLVVTAATSKSWYQEPQLGPVIAYGRGYAGEITSSSTHRAGLATNLDIAPTVLAALGIDSPATMVGAPMAAQPATGSLAERISALERRNAGAGSVDQLRDAWFIRCFVTFALMVLALATALVWRRRRRGRGLARTLLLLLLAIPPAGWLMFAVSDAATSPASALGAFVLATALVLALALGLLRRIPRMPLLPPIALAALTTVVILADQWSGRPIESGLFSYSIRSGWRYYGMGNEPAALLVAASLVAVGLGVDVLAGSRFQTPLRRFGVPVIGAVVLITAAAPFAGANAGVAVWGVVAYAVGWAAMNGVRLNWRTALFAAIGVLVAVAAFAAIDMAGARSGETHLARFAGGILRGDVSATAELVLRKLSNNLGYLGQTPYALLFIGFGGMLALLRFDRGRDLSQALASKPAYSGALLGVLLGGLAALATEDSGIVMPALMLLAGATPVLLIALSGEGPGDGSPGTAVPLSAPRAPAPRRELVGAAAERD